MEIKEVAELAKRHIKVLLTEEGAENIGLEEIEHDPATETWLVTVGFSRPWDRLNENPIASVVEMMGTQRKRVRDMKVVVVRDSDGAVLSVKIRE